MDTQNKNVPADKDMEFSLEQNRDAAVDVHLFAMQQSHKEHQGDTHPVR